MSALPLKGRAAIITGASQGLGLAIAEAFAAAGADLMLCARTPSDLDQAAATLRASHPARRIEASVADVSQTAEIERVFDAALERLGGLSVLVNNAGVHGPLGPIETIDWDAWVNAIQVNLIGGAYACRHALRHFKAAGYGKIINLSGGGATAPQPGLSAYGASKAAIVRLTETLAHEAPGIDINAVAPGALDTRLTRELEAAGSDKIGKDYHDRVRAMLAEGGASPLKAAELCVYLASAASDGLTGRLISAAWDPWPFDAASREDVTGSDIYTLRRITPNDRGKKWGS